MIGRDRSEADEVQWEGLAQFFAETQLRELFDAAYLVLSRGLFPKSAPVVGAGVGRTVIRTLAHRLGRPYLAFEDVLPAFPPVAGKASDCAAAAAVALLAGAFSSEGDPGSP